MCGFAARNACASRMRLLIRQGEEAALQRCFGVAPLRVKPNGRTGWRLRSREGDAGNGERCRQRRMRDIVDWRD